MTPLNAFLDNVKSARRALIEANKIALESNAFCFFKCHHDGQFHGEFVIKGDEHLSGHDAMTLHKNIKTQSDVFDSIMPNIKSVMTSLYHTNQTRFFEREHQITLNIKAFLSEDSGEIALALPSSAIYYDHYHERKSFNCKMMYSQKSWEQYAGSDIQALLDHSLNKDTARYWRVTPECPLPPYYPPLQVLAKDKATAMGLGRLIGIEFLHKTDLTFVPADAVEIDIPAKWLSTLTA